MKSKKKIFNTHISIQRNIAKILGFQRELLPSKYLGVTFTANPLHKSIWDSVINKLQDKVKKWTFRSLNLASRLVLTKAILQSIHVFMLSVLPAPQSVLHHLRSIQRDFLWGKGDDRKKWVLVAWDKISKPKSFGGVGLDDPDLLNKVLGAKLWWQWVKEPETQWETIWKEKYASTWHNHDLIRMTGHRKGAHTSRTKPRKTEVWSKETTSGKSEKEISVCSRRTDGNNNLYN